MTFIFKVHLFVRSLSLNFLYSSRKKNKISTEEKRKKKTLKFCNPIKMNNVFKCSFVILLPAFVRNNNLSKKRRGFV